MVATGPSSLKIQINQFKTEITTFYPNERETQRETDRQTDRETETDRDRQTDRQTENCVTV